MFCLSLRVYGTNTGEDVGGMCASVLLFGGGVCLPAPFCNYWLDLTRRKNVALWALAGIVCATVAFLFDGLRGEVAARMMQGASYSVFQIALGSTLLLDLSDTKSGRKPHMSIIGSLVWLWSSVLCRVLSCRCITVYAFCRSIRGFSACAGLLVLTMRVPFRAPLEPIVVYIRPFWLPRDSGSLFL